MENKMEDRKSFCERMIRHWEVYKSARKDGRLSLALELNQKMYEEQFERYKEVLSICKNREAATLVNYFELGVLKEGMEWLVDNADEMLSRQLKPANEKWGESN